MAKKPWHPPTITKPFQIVCDEDRLLIQQDGKTLHVAQTEEEANRWIAQHRPPSP